MSEWQTYKLREVGALQRGRSRHRPRYAFHLFNGPYPFIQTGEVREARKYISTFENTYSEAGLAQSKLWPKGTLCITIAANIAELGILGFDACFPDSVLGFIPDTSKSDLDFVYYTLTHFQKQLKHIGEGSVQDNINLGTFEDIEFPFPSLPEQKAIASVLSSLDDKIDLLHRQNKTLEAMAETLFRHWFIEEAKEDWEEKPLDEVVSHFIDYRGKTPNKTTSGIPLITAKIVKAGRIQEPTEFISEEDYPIWMTRGYPEINDVVLTTEAPLGEIGLIRDTNVALAQRIITMRCNPSIFDNVLLKYYLMSEVGQYELDSRASGTTVFGIKASVLKKLSLPIPSLAEQKVIAEQLHTIEDKMYANEQQSRSLAQLRDTLLPKLMSGEVRVQYQTEEVA